MWIQGALALNIMVLTTFLQPPRNSKETETTKGQDIPAKSEKLTKVSETLKENFNRITGCRLGSCVCDALLCVGTIVSNVWTQCNCLCNTKKGGEFKSECGRKRIFVSHLRKFSCLVEVSKCSCFVFL